MYLHDTFRDALRQAKRLPGRHLAGRWSLALCALLVAASTASVVATQNTPVDITSATLSKSVIEEGDTVTLSFNFADPDPGNGHSVYITWGQSARTWKWRQPIGARSFQIDHTIKDDRNAYGQTDEGIGIHVTDHQQPFDSNDNLDGESEDHHYLPITVRNVAPSIGSNVAVSKTRPKPTTVLVTLTGAIKDPGIDDTHEVTAIKDAGPKVAATAGTPCPVSERRFKCEVTYIVPASLTTPSTTQAIMLKVKDDDGGERITTTTVQVP